MPVQVQTRRPSRGEVRALDARAGNDHIAEKAARLQFVSRVPKLCECSAPGCRTIMLVALPDYREIRRPPSAFLAAPGHDAEATELARTTPTYTVRRGGLRSA